MAKKKPAKKSAGKVATKEVVKKAVKKTVPEKKAKKRSGSKPKVVMGRVPKSPKAISRQEAGKRIVDTSEEYIDEVNQMIKLCFSK